MLGRHSLVVLASVLLGLSQNTVASPITFAFTGSINEPINGSNQFSGSLTINGDPTLSGNPGSVTESGSDVSMVLNIGGQKFDVVNQTNSPSSVSFTAGLSPSWIINPTGPQMNEAQIISGIGGTNPSANFNFGFSFYSLSSSDQLDNLRNFTFPIGSSSVGIFGTLGDFSGQADGYITSFEQVPTATPEPSTLAMFVVFGSCVLVLRRRGSTTVDRSCVHK